MITMEELIQLQKREEAAQKAAFEKEKQAALKAAAADQVPPAKPEQSDAKKNKEKGIATASASKRLGQSCASAR